MKYKMSVKMTKKTNQFQDDIGEIHNLFFNNKKISDSESILSIKKYCECNKCLCVCGVGETDRQIESYFQNNIFLDELSKQQLYI